MEERNIKISLEKAKEWYKQGGELKEVALQAFSEDEVKGTFPESWSEYNINTNLVSNWKDHCINAGGLPGSAGYCYFTNEEEAKAFVALGKLIQLRDEYWRLDDNWKPDWNNGVKKYCIHLEKDTLVSEEWMSYNRILSFRTKALCNKFYENFKDLIEQAKMFL